jgi:type IV pilus assembly protein PilE
MKDAKGFTLIELMIVVAVVGILSMVALPQYQQYVIRGNRAAAEAFMMDVANRQKQYLLDARSYAPDLATLTMTPPTNVSNNYTVTVSAPVVAGAPPTFTVTAAVVPGSKQANDGGLTLNDLGTKLPVGKW